MKYFLAIIFFINMSHVFAQLQSNEPYHQYQWSLYNSGNAISLVTDETAELGEDIGFVVDNLPVAIDSLLKRDVVIAVLDTGIDYHHPDIKNSLALNLADCVETSPGNYIPADTDNDKNGFIGDCFGWNFVPDKDAPKYQLPRDLDGHGTHLAGIMAAQKNNQDFIGSLSSKVKVLPLRIYDYVNGLSPEFTLKRALEGFSDLKLPRGDIIATAIDYAIQRKVDVINMSFGFNNMIDDRKLIKSLRRAQQQGIILVAAAGNDLGTAFLKPCLYPEVLCVGAFNPQGKLAKVSNFGTAVDIYAPGEDILSLWPRGLVASLFPVIGLNQDSGTSQAAAYTSLVASILKGIYPQESEWDIRARIMGSSREFQVTPPFVNDKLRGKIHLKKSIEWKTDFFYYPEIKTLRYLIVDEQMQFNSKLKLKYKTSKAQSIKYHFSSSTFNGQLGIKEDDVILNADQNEIEISFFGKFNSWNDHADHSFKLTLETNGETYTHTFDVSFFLKKELAQRLRTQKVVELPRKNEEGQLLKAPALIPVTYLSDNALGDSFLELGTQRFVKTPTVENPKDGFFAIDLLRENTTKYEVVHTWELKDFKQFFGIHKLSSKKYQYDEYVLSGMIVINVGDKQKALVRFQRFNKHFKLISEFDIPSEDLLYEPFQDTTNGRAFFPINFSKGLKFSFLNLKENNSSIPILAVSFLREKDGRTPESQRTQSETQRDRENFQRPHLYYFTSEISPQEQNNKIKSVHAGFSELKLRECLGLKNFETISNFFRTADQVQWNHFSFYVLVQKRSTKELFFVTTAQVTNDEKWQKWVCSPLSKKLNFRLAQLSTAVPFPSADIFLPTTHFYDFAGPWFQKIQLEQNIIKSEYSHYNKNAESFFDLAHFKEQTNEHFSFWMRGRMLVATNDEYPSPANSPIKLELPLFIPIGSGGPGRFFQVSWSMDPSNPQMAPKPSLIFNSNLMTEPGVRILRANEAEKKLESYLKFQHEWDPQCRLLTVANGHPAQASAMTFYCDYADKWAIEKFILE